MSKYENGVTSALEIVKKCGVVVSDRKLYVRGTRLQTGEPGVNSVGIRAWGAIDYLRANGYSVVYELSEKTKAEPEY